MSQIKVARYSGVKYEFVDGYARVPVLEGEFDQAHFAHCALQPLLHHTGGLLRHRAQPALYLHQGQGLCDHPPSGVEHQGARRIRP